MSTERRSLELGNKRVEITLVEHRDFLAAVFDVDRWLDIDALAEDLVAAVASIAEGLDASPRLWDLTVVALVAQSLDEDERHHAVPWSTRTQHARRLLATGVSVESLRQALAPLLPLVIEAKETVLGDPAQALAERLSSELGPEVVDAAIHSFEATGKIEL